MSRSEPIVEFHGHRYLLIGDLEQGGPIATVEQYEAGECSYAHLNPDGAIMRFGEQIGAVDDLKVVDSCVPEIGVHSLIGMLSHPSWDEGMGMALWNSTKIKEAP